MSRIPVFIEKKARKGWGNNNEACIFIACDSTDSSGENVELEIDENGESTEISEMLERDNLDDPLKKRLFESDDFDKSGEMIREHNSNGLVTENEISTDMNVSSNTYPEKDNIVARTLDGGVDIKHVNDSKDTCLSVAVVSCCKGVIQGKCTCSKCGGQPEILDQLNDFSSKHSPKVLHSLLPVPTKLKPGKIEITPAPVKRSNVKKKNMINLNKNKTLNHLEFNIEPDDCSKVAGDNKKGICDFNNADNVSDRMDKPDVDISENYSRSVHHDYEDSEPESTQHEYQKLLEGIQKLDHKDRVIDFRSKDSKNISSKQAVLNMVHRSSGIPIFRSVRSDNITPVSRCISVSPRSSVTTRLTVSRSSDRPSSSTSTSSVGRGVNKSSVSRNVSPVSVPTTPTNNTNGLSAVASHSNNKRFFNKSSRNASNERENMNDSSSNKHLISDSQKRGNVEGKTLSKDKQTLRSKERLTSEGSIDLIKRHLPNAPSQKRVVKYGERCDERNSRAQQTASQKKSPRLKQSYGRSADSSLNSHEIKNKDADKEKQSDIDLRERLQCMEEEIKKMAEQNDRLSKIESTHSQLSRTMAEKERIAEETNVEIIELKKRLRDTEDNLHGLKRQLERDKESFEITKTSLQSQKRALEREVTALQEEVSGLKQSVAQLTSLQAGIQAELESTKLALEQSTRYGREKDTENISLRKTIREKEEIIDEANRQLQHHETVRRKLHNTIQELKGNIRVFCRVRPLIDEEVLDCDGIHHMAFPEEDNRTLELEKLGETGLNGMTMGGLKRSGTGRHQFTFDRVFAPESTQVEVFEEISQLVQSALDGYNVCIFAYGQTGSGKTYTMEGPDQMEEETRGMIPRAVLQIFTCVRELAEKGWKYSFEATFLEIYNETIRDLIGNHGKHVRHEIKLGTGGEDVTVTYIASIPINEENQVLELLQKASQNRSVGETQCNERSSRSHSVFRLKISGSNSTTGESCCGTLNLVDLAGSEKLKDSGATGQRLKETQNINKSLSNLGNVIMALANKESFIPYRNSKLTYLLQNSLGGNSKTLMFVNVSPKEDNFAETLNSLRFATKVNQCNIGTATRKTK